MPFFWPIYLSRICVYRKQPQKRETVSPRGKDDERCGLPKLPLHATNLALFLSPEGLGLGGPTQKKVDNADTLVVPSSLYLPPASCDVSG